jgi:hypothetical protein
MTLELIEELKLLGAAEELVIRNVNRHLNIKRRLTLPTGVRLIDTAVSFQCMEQAAFDILATTLRNQRDHIRSTELQEKNDVSQLSPMNE